MSLGSLECGEQVFGLAVHPHRDLLAAGLIDGRVTIFAPSTAANLDAEDGVPPLVSLAAHSRSCRAVAFNAIGDTLYAAGSDGSLAVFDDQGREKSRVQVSEVAVNKVVAAAGQSMVVVGDDEGGVRLLDARSGETAVAWEEHEDFVSSLLTLDDDARLLSTAGDRTLCEYDLRSARPVRRSVEQEDELLCVQSLKLGRKLTCGALNGTVLIFSSTSLEDCSDRFPGHPAAVNCMLKVGTLHVLELSLIEVSRSTRARC